MDGGRGLLQTQGEGRPVADELRRGPRHAVGKLVQRVKQGGLFVPVLQDAGLILIELVEIRQDLRVARADLADGVVHEPPPHGRAFLDEVQVVRTEEHGVDRVGELPGGLFDGIDQDALRPSRREAQVYGLLPLVTVDVGKDIRTVRAEAHQLLVEAGAEAPAHGEHVHGLKQIGFALRVLPADDIGPGVKFRRLKLVISKGAQGDAPDDHAFATSSVQPWKSTLSPG